jgi:hypothetical protein
VEPDENIEAGKPGTIVEAEIRLGGVAVRYLRAGSGSPVVLLLGDSAPGEGPGEPFTSLAREHRVFRPVGRIPGGRDEAERWLRGLVEGLGLREPDVVAEARFAPLLSRLVRRNGGFVGRVVFLAPRGEADEGRGGM